MTLGNRVIRTLGVLLYALGVVLGLALTAVATWGDLEATMFDADIGADAGLGSLRCPILLTENETGVVSASFRNPTDRQIQPYIRTHISEGYISLIREVRTDVPLAPGEKQRLEWTVTADDAVFGRLVLVRVQTFRTYPLPSRRGSCGIVLVNLNWLSGRGIAASVVAASLVSMTAGLGLWIRRSQPLHGRTRNLAGALATLLGIVVLGLVASLLGWWVLGLVVVVVAVLVVGAIMRDVVAPD